MPSISICARAAGSCPSPLAACRCHADGSRPPGDVWLNTEDHREKAIEAAPFNREGYFRHRCCIAKSSGLPVGSSGSPLHGSAHRFTATSLDLTTARRRGWYRGARRAPEYNMVQTRRRRLPCGQVSVTGRAVRILPPLYRRFTMPPLPTTFAIHTVPVAPSSLPGTPRSHVARCGCRMGAGRLRRSKLRQAHSSANKRVKFSLLTRRRSPTALVDGRSLEVGYQMGSCWSYRLNAKCRRAVAVRLFSCSLTGSCTHCHAPVAQAASKSLTVHSAGGHRDIEVGNDQRARMGRGL